MSPTPLTVQVLYDRVARHLLTQAAQSRSPEGDGCRYRSSAGLRCAIGALIPDALYSADLEGRPVWASARVQTAVGLPLDMAAPVTRLAWACQCLHDDTEPSIWPVRLCRLAAEHGLSHAVLDEPSSLRLSPRLAARLSSPEVRYGSRVDLYATRVSLMADPAVRPIYADTDGPTIDGRPAYVRGDIVAYDLADGAL